MMDFHLCSNCTLSYFYCISVIFLSTEPHKAFITIKRKRYVILWKRQLNKILIFFLMKKKTCSLYLIQILQLRRFLCHSCKADVFFSQESNAIISKLHFVNPFFKNESKICGIDVNQIWIKVYALRSLCQLIRME